MYMRNRCGNIVLDARIGYYDGGGRGWRGLQNYVVKLVSMRFIVFSFIADIERNMIWEIVNYSKSRREFWMKRSKGWETFVKPISHVDYMAFDEWTLSIGERIERDEVMSWGGIVLWVHEEVYKVIRR